MNRPIRSVARFEPVPGSVVADKYRVERVLGEGGMGIVVAATHLGLEQRVAIKFLLPEALRHEEAVERFQREAKVAAKVRSEHVARVHDVGTLAGGEPFIVMEYLEGSDLRQALKAGVMPVDEACEIALQACEALAEVHAAGIVHRDLKPSNLFVTRRSDGSPCVKLLDFGISKFGWDRNSGADPALTATATIMGSPSYMSPEQLKSTREVDARTDVWSLGAVLYEALTGRAAFLGDTVPQVCAMIAADAPPPPSSVRAQVPAGLDRPVLACLEKNPDQRGRLVDLARALVEFAPDRARVSLERVEAVLGEPPRSRAPTGHGGGELPVLPLASAGRGRTSSASAWNESAGALRKGGVLRWIVLLAAALAGLGVWTGNLDVPALRGRIVGATSAVASAVASALPPAPAPPVADPPAAAEPVVPVPSAAAPASSAAPAPSASYAAPSFAAPAPSAMASAPPVASDEPDGAAPRAEAEAPAPVVVPAASAAATHSAASAHAGAPSAAPVRHPVAKPRHGASKVRKHH